MTPPLRLLFAFAACLLVSGLSHVEEMKKKERFLLRSLGLHARPRASASSQPRRKVPSALWRIFQRLENDQDQAQIEAQDDPCMVPEYGVRGNIIRYVQDQGQLLSGWSRSCQSFLEKHIFFNMSVMQPEELLSLAQLELKLHRQPIQTTELVQGPRALGVSLYKVIRAGLKGTDAQSHRRLLLAQSVQLQREPTSITLDVTSLAEGWRKLGSNFGLHLELKPLGTDPEELFPFRSSNALPFEPAYSVPLIQASLVVVSLNLQQCQSRQRRSTFHLPFTPSNVCKARRLYIDFRDVGWDHWVIAPQGYMINYCRGECPFPLSESLRGTNHAILQTLVHSLDPDETPQPCCVPVRLSPVSMLYYDNNDNVVLRHYEDMVVEECGCH